MTKYLVFIENPKHPVPAQAFLRERGGRDIGDGWWEIGSDDRFRPIFVNLWQWVRKKGFLYVCELGGSGQRFSYPPEKRAKFAQSQEFDWIPEDDLDDD